MRILARLRDELDHTRRVWKDQNRLIEADGTYQSTTSLVTKAVCAEQIADRLGRQADHLEVSWLARATTSLPKPSVLRSQAAGWRQRAEELWLDSANNPSL